MTDEQKERLERLGIDAVNSVLRLKNAAQKFGQDGKAFASGYLNSTRAHTNWAIRDLEAANDETDNAL